MERTIYNVRTLGAVADGRTPDTAAIQAAADACKTSGGGIIYIPDGEYLTSSIRLYSHTELRMARGARLIADPTEAHYAKLRGAYDTPFPRDAKTLIGVEDNGALDVLKQLILSTKRGSTDCILFAENAEDITVTGGEIHGNALQFFDTVEKDGITKYKPHLFRPQLIVLKGCRGVTVKDLHLTESPYFNIRAIACESVRFENLTVITNIHYINTDGINIAACKDATVIGCYFETGDDCIAISNGEFTPLLQDCENIRVSSCTARAKANLVRVFNGIEADLSVLSGIGGEEQLSVARAHAVKNVKVSDCAIERGACAINMVGTLGRIENVEFSNIRATDTATAIFIVTQKDGTIRGVTVRELSCETVGGVTLQGTTRESLSDIRLIDCDLHITPKPRLFGNGLIDPLIHYWLAASSPYNLYLRHASEILIEGVTVRWGEGKLSGIERFAKKENRRPEYEHLWREDMMPRDAFPCVQAFDVHALTVKGLNATGYNGEKTINVECSERIIIK